MSSMLIYSMSVSVDGFIADREGAFDWTGPWRRAVSVSPRASVYSSGTVSISSHVLSHRSHMARTRSIAIGLARLERATFCSQLVQMH